MAWNFQNNNYNCITIKNILVMISTHYKRNKYEGKRFTQPSQTVPDQTIDIKTMVTKYVRGMPINAPHMNGIFTEDEIATDFSKLDLADKETLTINRAKELTELKTKLKTQQAQAKPKQDEK